MSCKSKRVDSRCKQPQLFEKYFTDKWLKTINSLEEGSVLSLVLSPLLVTKSLDQQLECVKEVLKLIHNNDSDNDTHIKCLICCLVEMHSVCSPRHILQRNIARCIDSIGTIYKKDVYGAIRSELLKILQSTTNQTLCIDYIQSFMEHYKNGEYVMMSLLPHVLECLVGYMESGLKNLQIDNSFDHEFLISTVKVLLNVLHHGSAVIIKILFKTNTETDTHSCSQTGQSGGTSETDTHSCSQTSTRSHSGVCETDTYSDIGSIIEWPLSVDDNHIHWMKGRLQVAMNISHQILHNDFYLPKDLVMSVSMLYVVAMTIKHHDNLPSTMKQFFHEWFTSSVPHINEDNRCFSQLSLCHATLAKTSPYTLNSINIDDSNETMFYSIFPIICSLLDHFTETAHRFLAAKTLALWSNLLRICLNGSSRDLHPNSPIVVKLLQYVRSLWEDPIEGIRHQCKSIFDSLICYYQTIPDKETHLLALAHPLLSLTSPTRGKYSLLASLVPHINISVLIIEWSDLPQELMNTMGLQVLACRSGDLWSVMVAKHFQELENNVDVWKKVWLIPLVCCLLNGSVLAKEHVKQYCLSSTLTVLPNMLEIIYGVIDEMSHDLSCDNTNKLMAQLSCMECAIISGCGLPNDNHLLMLASAIQHCDEQIVMSALRLLCESKRPTEIVPLSYLPLISRCIQLHMNSQSPAFRNQTISTFKKLLCRICDSSHNYIHSTNKKKRKTPLLSLLPSTDVMVDQYKMFLNQVCQNCFQSLHPLSNFQRRNLALALLDIITQQLNPAYLPSTISTVYSYKSLLSNNCVRDLVYVLYDTFDDNRVLAIKVLDKIIGDTKSPEEFFPCINHIIDDYHRLICSPKSTDCATGYRMTKLLIKHSLTPTLVHLSKLTCTPLEEGCNPYVSFIKCLLAILNDHVTISSKDLVKASLTAPMYGVLQSVRSILEDINISYLSIQHRNQLGVVINDVIDICVHIGKIVSLVVCNSSPEGFILPTLNHTIQDCNNIEEYPRDSCHGNSQSLLVCCWRSMKETIQLLSVIIDIVQETPVEIEFTKEEIISDLILYQLTKAYHRGAFEIAHVGFVKLCTYLWNKHDCRKPVVWVNELMESLMSSSMTQLLSITRRSAGLPFYVQAILVTEPSSTGRTCLKHVMSMLLDIASSHSVLPKQYPQTEQKDSEQLNPFEVVPQPSSVHALNILRGLYRDNKLGEHMTPYITEGLKIAITGFSVQYWPVRNSCTLLFSTLIMRIFGVKRVQDERSIENKMTSREFFSRFPSLHSFLLEELTQSDQHLFPVLLLLSRLYPSPLDDDHGHLSLVPFQSPILIAAGSPIWKCRVLASDAILPTLSLSNLHNVLTVLSDSLSIQQQNKTHGILLMILSILNHSSPTGKTGEIVLSITTEALHTLFTILMKKFTIGLSSNMCHITRGSYIDAITCLLPFIDHTPHTAPIKQLIKNAETDLMNGQLEGLPLANELPFSLLSLLMVTKSVVETDLSWIDLLIRSWQHYSHIDEFIDYISNSFDAMTIKQFNILADIAIGKACKELKEGYIIMTALLQRKYSFSSDVIGSLFEQTANRLCKGYLKEDLIISMIDFLSIGLVVVNNINNKVLNDVLVIMKSWCCDTYPDNIRYAIARFLGNNWKQFIDDSYTDGGRVPHQTSVQSNAFLFWTMTMVLLQDVEESVRNKMCKSVTPLLYETSQIDSCDDSLCQQSTLHAVITSIPLLYRGQIEHATKILLHILDICSQPATVPSTSQDKISALLFEEDKCNSYTEPVQLFEYVMEAIRNIPTAINMIDSMFDKLALNDDQCDGDSFCVDSGNLWEMKNDIVQNYFKKQYLCNMLK